MSQQMVNEQLATSPEWVARLLTDFSMEELLRVRAILLERGFEFYMGFAEIVTITPTPE